MLSFARILHPHSLLQQRLFGLGHLRRTSIRCLWWPRKSLIRLLLLLLLSLLLLSRSRSSRIPLLLCKHRCHLLLLS